MDLVNIDGHFLQGIENAFSWGIDWSAGVSGLVNIDGHLLQGIANGSRWGMDCNGGVGGSV